MPTAPFPEEKSRRFPFSSAAIDGTDADKRAASGLRVLVADDHPDAAATLARLVGCWGHQVRTANQRQEIFDAAVMFRPHVLIIDLGLSRGAGGELISQLRASRPQVRIWALSVFDVSHPELRLEGRFDAILRKPVRASDLQDRLAAEAQDLIDGSPR
ncbi:MAG: response regulator [Planctomyces sp.]|nr:response regulator [Planctomyces sp.]